MFYKIILNYNIIKITSIFYLINLDKNIETEKIDDLNNITTNIIDKL